jgi:hypothetical protein
LHYIKDVLVGRERWGGGVVVLIFTAGGRAQSAKNTTTTTTPRGGGELGLVKYIICLTDYTYLQTQQFFSLHFVVTDTI